MIDVVSRMVANAVIIYLYSLFFLSHQIPDWYVIGRQSPAMRFDTLSQYRYHSTYQLIVAPMKFEVIDKLLMIFKLEQSYDLGSQWQDSKIQELVNKSRSTGFNAMK